MTSLPFAPQSAISRKDLSKDRVPLNIANMTNISHIPTRIPANISNIPPLPLSQLPPLPKLPMIQQSQSLSLSPISQPIQIRMIKPTPLQLQSQSMSPTIITKNIIKRDRKRIREISPNNDNKDTKRRKLDIINNSTNPSISASLNGSGVSVTALTPKPLPFNSAASHCSSISKTSSSASNNSQMDIDNNKEIHIALQNLAALVSKNKTTESPTNNATNTHTNNSTQQQTIQKSHKVMPRTVGLAIPNININSINPINGIQANANSNNSFNGSSTDRINQFIFGNNDHHRLQNGNANNTNTNTNNASSNIAVSPALQTQLFTAMGGIGGSNGGAAVGVNPIAALSINDIDHELQKELSKREMRKIISHQLENLRQQMLRQEREDEAKLQALKFMKMIQSTQQIKHNVNADNKLPLNYNITPKKHPLPLPQFLNMPAVNHGDNGSDNKVVAILSGYNNKSTTLPSMSNSNEWNAVSHSDEYKENVDGHIDDMGQIKYNGHGRETIIAATGKIQPRKDMDEQQCALLCNLMVELCFTEGLETKIFNQVEFPKKNVKHIKSINALKIDPEICLNMNLNTNSRMNGFSSMIGSNNIYVKQQSQQRNTFNIIPPTFQQTSSSIANASNASNSSITSIPSIPSMPSVPSVPCMPCMPMPCMMPGLETEGINPVSSSCDSASSASASASASASTSASSCDESVEKFKSDSDSEDEIIQKKQENNEDIDIDIDMNINNNIKQKNEQQSEESKDCDTEIIQT